MSLPTTASTWAEPATEEVAAGAWRIPRPLPGDGLRAVNVYALADGDGVTLIDGGWALDAARSTPPWTPSGSAWPTFAGSWSPTPTATTTPRPSPSAADPGPRSCSAPANGTPSSGWSAPDIPPCAYSWSCWAAPAPSRCWPQRTPPASAATSAIPATSDPTATSTRAPRSGSASARCRRWPPPATPGVGARVNVPNPLGPNGGSPVRKLLAACRIRSESFVAELRGGRRGRRDKEP
jgi:hypothetical protein